MADVFLAPYVFLLLGLFVFMFVLSRLGLVTKVKTCFADTRAALAIMRAADVSDDEKEKAIQRATVRMGGAFLDILMRTVATLLAPTALVFAGIAAGLYASEEAVAAASNPYFLIALTVLAIGMLRFAR